MACKGECTAGITTCVGKDLVCIPGKGPTQEKCDGKDNDCDGVKDNGFNFSTDPNNCGSCGVSCVDTVPNAVGQCMDLPAPPPACSILACKPGFKDLDPSKAGCEKCPKFPTSAEICNGIDDDCDGVVDNMAPIADQKPAVDVFCNNGRALGTTPCAGTTVSCGGANGWICNYLSATGVENRPGYQEGARRRDGVRQQGRQLRRPEGRSLLEQGRSLQCRSGYLRWERRLHLYGRHQGHGVRGDCRGD